MKTLSELIAELNELATEYGGDIAVQTDEGEDPMCEYNEDDPDDTCVVVG